MGVRVGDRVRSSRGLGLGLGLRGLLEGCIGLGLGLEVSDWRIATVGSGIVCSAVDEGENGEDPVKIEASGRVQSRRWSMKYGLCRAREKAILN